MSVKPTYEELEERVRELEEESKRLKLAEETLRESEERHRSIFENSLDGIILSCPDGRILAANPEACMMHGYTEGEIRSLGRNGIADTGDPRLKELIVERSRVGKFRGEVTHIRKDGTKFPCELSTAVFSNKKGRDSVVVIVRDVTGRKQAEEERKRLIEELQRSQEELEMRVERRTAELEQSNNVLLSLNRELQEFAFVASHDLQEPLRKIQLFGEMVVGKFKNSLDEKGIDYLDRMQDAAKRMQTLLTALLDYSRVATRADPFCSVDLNEVAKEAISNVDFWIRQENGRVEIEDLPVLETDRSQMVRLFQNLLSNGLKYHKPNEAPLVRVYSAKEAKDESGEMWLIMFQDNGIGFEEKYREQIFKPFERLHGKSSPYTGVGMGLAICKKIVERHGGTITAESTPGNGSTFIVTLPVRQKTNGD